MRHFWYLLVLAILFGCNSNNQQTQTSIEADKTQILQVLKTQENAWNQRDFEGFMQGYLNSDSLKFYGRNGLTKGWQNTLDNYIKGYPTAAESGTLTFKINDISPIETNSYWVMGEFFLERTVGNANGIFMLIFKKIDGEWKIVADMSA
ncbi:nuclear transport factor 2 family protein [Paucihalobacter ruber]|uniref:Nuclear transport factor 2 family protein n=1 Tax=Paucihalobacter ruber TaxID=2567861 RepID=A0A506PDB3_9FLAO|nr:nuclear transport factor 2 family protein [Paucihalobacter ruber]TPV31816.1 nuclear transport factor 2 family protein [Paucihalobacter ruber]